VNQGIETCFSQQRTMLPSRLLSSTNRQKIRFSCTTCRKLSTLALFRSSIKTCLVLNLSSAGLRKKLDFQTLWYWPSKPITSTRDQATRNLKVLPIQRCRDQVWLCNQLKPPRRTRLRPKQAAISWDRLESNRNNRKGVLNLEEQNLKSFAKQSK